MITLSETLGLETVAEGIESDKQADALIALGCRAGQGFLFARPGPLAEVAPLPAVPESRPLLRGPQALLPADVTAH